MIRQMHAESDAHEEIPKLSHRRIQLPSQQCCSITRSDSVLPIRLKIKQLHQCVESHQDVHRWI